VTKDLLTVFGSAIAGAATIVFVLRIAIKIFAPNAFKASGRFAGRVTTHDVAAVKNLPVVRITLRPGRSALSATDPVSGNSQAGFVSEEEQKEHWSSRLVAPQ